MYSIITLRLLTPADVEDLSPRLRIEDKDETVCLGSNPRDALLMGSFDNVFSASRGRAYAIVDNGTVIGAIGFSSAGFLWALSTKFTHAQRRQLFARTDEIVGKLLKEAMERRVINDDIPFLHNVISGRNKGAVKWLIDCGLFMVDLDNPIELKDQTFYNFRTLMPYEIPAHV